MASPFDVDAVGRIFFPPDRRAKADTALVFGMSSPARPAACAVELFRAGLVERLLFTGGFNELLGRPEAHAMAEFACHCGVPDEAILIEDQARNTDENIAFSKSLLDERFGHKKIRSLMLVTVHYHLRRAHIAARRHFSADVELYWMSYPHLGYTSANWFDAEKGRNDVQAEIDKIERYYGITLKDLADHRE